MLATPNHNVIVGMSGGVDSSVAAYMLQQQGFHVEGLFMKNWEEDDGTEYCTAKEDLADAQAVCDVLGIQLHTEKPVPHKIVHASSNKLILDISQVSANRTVQTHFEQSQHMVLLSTSDET